jgi:hypothetical protein
MSYPVTIVTAFFDINRAENGDGRTIEEYLQWIHETLKLNCQLYVVTEQKYASFFASHRPLSYPMTLKIIDFKESHYYRYYEQIKSILSSEKYKKKIAYPNRVECILPEYSILQYSKFHYLQMAIKDNPYCSEFFFWMDAGASRFFDNLDLSLPYPSTQGQKRLYNHRDKFVAQQRHDLLHYHLDEHFIWKADNLIYGGTFGGYFPVVQMVSQAVEEMFMKEMLEKDNVNNEQLALALVWKTHPEWFHLVKGLNCLETFHYLT